MLLLKRLGCVLAMLVPLALSVGTYLSWATIVVGAALVLLGLWLLSGREIVVRVPRLSGVAPTEGRASMVVYGVAYAVASLSCTIAPFLAVTTSTFRLHSPLAGIAVFLAYAIGMGMVVGVLAVSVALAQDGLVQRLRGVMPYVNRISGVLLVVAGAYVVYYGVYELRLAQGEDDVPRFEQRGVRQIERSGLFGRLEQEDRNMRERGLGKLLEPEILQTSDQLYASIEDSAPVDPDR